MVRVRVRVRVGVRVRVRPEADSGLKCTLPISRATHEPRSCSCPWPCQSGVQRGAAGRSYRGGRKWVKWECTSVG